MLSEGFQEMLYDVREGFHCYANSRENNIELRWSLNLIANNEEQPDCIILEESEFYI